MLHCVVTFDEKLQNLATVVIYKVIRGTKNFQTMDLPHQKKLFLYFNFIFFLHIFNFSLTMLQAYITQYII